MTRKIKMWCLFGAALACLIATLLFANQALFFAWQSAFTHANVKLLKKLFYACCAATLAAVAMMVKFLRMGMRMRMEMKEEK